MKVIFLQHVLHVAKVWEIKEVSPGYASNFLFPKKLAKPYNDEIKHTLEEQARKKESERRLLLGGKQGIIEALEHQVFEFFWKASREKVYGSITPKDVAEFITKKYRLPLTKKHIDFWWVHSNFKSLWDHDIYIDLGENYAVKAVVRISPQS